MNTSFISLEIAVVVAGLVLLLLDLWAPAEVKSKLGYGAAFVAGCILLYSFLDDGATTGYAFGNMFVKDSLSLYFKRFFLFAAIIVLLLSVEYSDRIKAGISEYYSLILFALAGMMFAASANDFSLLFVSLELITVTFYDAIPLIFPGSYFGTEEQRRHYLNCMTNVSTSDHVIAISKSAAFDLRQYTGYSLNQVSIAYPVIEGVFHPIAVRDREMPLETLSARSSETISGK